MKPEGQFESELLADVIPITGRGSETIDGVGQPLGRLTLLELTGLEKECRERYTEAQTDLVIVQDVIERRFPQRGGAA